MGNARTIPERTISTNKILGDVLDKERLQLALENRYCSACSSLEAMPATEYNPMEFVKTNVLVAENRFGVDSNVERVVALSTDKLSPNQSLWCNQLCSTNCLAANNIEKIKVLRGAQNVMGSRGSVIPFFIKKAKTGVLPITDIDMTRFNISLEESVEMVLWALEHTLGGEVFVPKIPSYKITDLADAIGPNCKKIIVGIRPGEKLHEEMITASDSQSTIDLGKYYAILPSDGEKHIEYEKAGISYNRVEGGFEYNSGSNNKFLNKAEIRELIKTHVDQNFIEH